MHDHYNMSHVRALEEFELDMVVYNAGTDVLKGDPLGVLDITPDVREDLFDILYKATTN